MGNWIHEQMVRLAVEEKLIKEIFPDFCFGNRTMPGRTCVRGIYKSSKGNSYELCVRIPNGYPFEMPRLYIVSPKPLYGYGFKSIQSYGTSHSMHVWKSDWNDYVKICHYKSDFWSASITLVKVIAKGVLWIEAFEFHKETGQTIDSISLSF